MSEILIALIVIVINTYIHRDQSIWYHVFFIATYLITLVLVITLLPESNELFHLKWSLRIW